MLGAAGASADRCWLTGGFPACFPISNKFLSQGEILPLWDAPRWQQPLPLPPPPPVPTRVIPAGGIGAQLLGVDKNPSGTNPAWPWALWWGCARPPTPVGSQWDVPGDARVWRIPWGMQNRDESCLRMLQALALHHQGLWCCSSRL